MVALLAQPWKKVDTAYKFTLLAVVIVSACGLIPKIWVTGDWIDYLLPINSLYKVIAIVVDDGIDDKASQVFTLVPAMIGQGVVLLAANIGIDYWRTVYYKGIDRNASRQVQRLQLDEQ